jgi:hypothetical protein
MLSLSDPRVDAIQALLRESKKREDDRQRAELVRRIEEEHRSKERELKEQEDKLKRLEILILKHNADQIEREKKQEALRRAEEIAKKEAELHALEQKKIADEKAKEVKAAAELAKLEAEKEAAKKAAEEKEKHEKELEELRKKVAEVEAAKKRFEEEAKKLRPGDDMLKTANTLVRSNELQNSSGETEKGDKQARESDEESQNQIHKILNTGKSFEVPSSANFNIDSFRYSDITGSNPFYKPKEAQDHEAQAIRDRRLEWDLERERLERDRERERQDVAALARTRAKTQRLEDQLEELRREKWKDERERILVEARENLEAVKRRIMKLELERKKKLDESLSQTQSYPGMHQQQALAKMAMKQRQLEIEAEQEKRPQALRHSLSNQQPLDQRTEERITTPEPVIGPGMTLISPDDNGEEIEGSNPDVEIYLNVFQELNNG